MATCTQSTELVAPGVERVITPTKNGRLKRTRSFNGIDSDLLFEASQPKKTNRGRPKKDAVGGGGGGAREGSNKVKPTKPAKSSITVCDLQNDVVASESDSESTNLTSVASEPNAGSDITLNELHTELKRMKTSFSKHQNTVGKLSKTATGLTNQLADIQCTLASSQNVVELDQFTNLQSVVKLLADQVSFLLSYVGVTDPSPLPPTTHPSKSSTNQHPSAEVNLPTDKRTPGHSSPSASYADLVKRPPAALQRTFQRSVVAAVYADQQRSNSQVTNVVISGLPPHSQAADKTVVRNLFVDEFQISLDVVKCRRLGRPSLGKIQPLLVVLRSAADADEVMACAKQLRKSSHAMIRDSVYINRHLTAAQSRAAFDLRCSRRSMRQGRADQEFNHPSQSGTSRDTTSRTLPHSHKPAVSAVVTVTPTSQAPSGVTVSEWLPLSQQFTSTASPMSPAGISSVWLPPVQPPSTSSSMQYQLLPSSTDNHQSFDTIPLFNYFAPLQQHPSQGSQVTYCNNSQPLISAQPSQPNSSQDYAGSCP